MDTEQQVAVRPGDTTETEPAAPWIAPGEPIISLRGVTKSFGSHTVFEDITFDVPKGRITAILGPSGNGKSVLLKYILGLLKPERGEIWVDGDQIVGLREKRLYEVRKKFGVLFQDGALFGSHEPLRQHRVPAARAHPQQRGRDPRARPPQRGTSRAHGPLEEAARRGFRRHEEAGRAGTRHGDGVRDRALRRAGLGPRPCTHRLPRRVGLDGAEGDGRHLLHHHAQHPIGDAHGRLHGPAVPLQPGEIRGQVRHGADRQPDHPAIPGRQARRADRDGRDCRRRDGLDASRFIEGDTAALAFGRLARTGEAAMTSHAPSDELETG